VSPAEPRSICPRCAGRFRCGVDDRAPCACAALKLDDELRAALRERYVGCLCIACLAELQAMRLPADSAIDPRPN
jgi:Cysteine-rich CWC